MNAQELRSITSRYVGRREALESQLEGARKRAEGLVARKASIDSLILAVQKAARDTQDQLRVRIEDVIQTALDAVFPDSYLFKTEFVARRGRTELDMWLDKDGSRMDPLDSNGGGVVDVISLALRVCCLTMSKNSRILLLDEPFPHIRGGARQRLGEVLGMISRRLGIQVIMVSDVAGTSIVPDREFQVSLDRSHISRVEVKDSEVSA
jgi:DNA repair exonuclease SbcCD ATPase subunit